MVDAVAELERGRQSYASQAWTDAFELLSAADRSDQLGAGDLELLATSAYMLGREENYLGILERAYRAHLDADEGLAALRCAFWIGVTLASGGEMGRAGGWLGRAQRLLDRQGDDCSCRASSSSRGAATWRRPPQLRPRRPQLASASAIRICSP